MGNMVSMYLIMLMQGLVTFCNGSSDWQSFSESQNIMIYFTPEKYRNNQSHVSYFGFGSC